MWVELLAVELEASVVAYLLRDHREPILAVVESGVVLPPSVVHHLDEVVFYLVLLELVRLHLLVVGAEVVVAQQQLLEVGA